jgi:HSP20 family protein
MTKNNEVAVVQQNGGVPAPRFEAMQNVVSPYTDIYENRDAYVLMLDMPGAGKDSIRVTLDRNELVVQASVGPYHGENATMLHNELRKTSYYRVFNLGNGIERTNVDAQFEHGVLTIKLYKSEQLKPREIRIN